MASLASRGRGRLVPGRLLDLALALLVLGLGVAQLLAHQLTGPPWASWGAVLAIAAAQLVRRTHVWVAVLVTFLAIAGSYAAGMGQYNFISSIVGALAVLATAGYTLALRPALLALVFGFACVVVTNQTQLPDLVWLVIVMGGPWAAGRALRSRRHLIDELRATTAELERSQAALAERAVAEERLRIARDVHDVVAHSVTVMLVQAAAAERTMHRGGADAVEAVQAVQDSGRQALGELRQLLGLLRPTGAGSVGSPDEQSVVAPPQPGLTEVGELVERFRQAGLTVRTDPADLTLLESAPVAPGAGLAAYRVVQESLTNVLKHSAARSACVRVVGVEGGVRVEVSDPGPARIAAPVSGGGHGLTGMRERVVAVGGRWTAASTEDGGFRVSAELPAGTPA